MVIFVFFYIRFLSHPFIMSFFITPCCPFLKKHKHAQDNGRYAKNDVDFLIRTLCHAFQL